MLLDVKEVNTFDDETSPDVQPLESWDSVQLLQRYRALGEQIELFGKKSAENVIRRCQLVFYANKLADVADQLEFSRGVGYSIMSSTWRKYKKIGEAADRLLPLCHRLPRGWTIHYELAKLSVDDFARVVNDELFGPKMKTKDIHKILGTIPEKKPPKRPVHTIKIDVRNLTPEDLYCFFRDLMKLGYPIKIHVSPTTETETYVHFGAETFLAKRKAEKEAAAATPDPEVAALLAKVAAAEAAEAAELTALVEAEAAAAAAAAKAAELAALAEAEAAPAPVSC
jgi:hypothetical protein